MEASETLAALGAVEETVDDAEHGLLRSLRGRLVMRRLRAAIAADDGDWAARYGLGYALLKRGRLRKARQQFDAVLTVAVAAQIGAAVCERIVRILLEADAHRDAAGYADSALRGGDATAQMLVDAAIAHYLRREDSDAVERTRQAMADLPRDPEQALRADTVIKACAGLAGRVTRYAAFVRHVDGYREAVERHRAMMENVSGDTYAREQIAAVFPYSLAVGAEQEP